MKIKTKKSNHADVLSLPRPKRKKPLRPMWLLAAIIRLISLPDLWATRFRFKKELMEKAGKGPYLILMNHSSFIDLKIAYRIFFPHRFCIVSTTDGFVGKSLLMRLLGCIPTQKYVTDVRLIMDMLYAIQKKKVSVLMYPEAGYSFDGRTTALPRRLGTLVKKLGVPLVSVITDGAYLRQPLYNNLHVRKVNTSATVTCLLSSEEIEDASVEQIDALIDKAFSFDNFRSQFENRVQITEKTRAEGLERILYRCPQCESEGSTVGRGSTLTCTACGADFPMNEYGQMEGSPYPHIPDWCDYQRTCVREEIIAGKYGFSEPVSICMLVDYKQLYHIGEGVLTHNTDGFFLKDSDGNTLFHQSPTASFTVNADFYWYEMGDVICIGDKKALYYCFPKHANIAAKTRLAAEEIHKIKQSEKNKM